MIHKTDEFVTLTGYSHNLPGKTPTHFASPSLAKSLSQS
jgi:hypothetical protein